MKTLKKIYLTMAISFTVLSPLMAQQNLDQQFLMRNAKSVLLTGGRSYINVVKEHKRQVRPIIVAVIDTGTSLMHPLLNPALYINSNEIPNSTDDDYNGFIDDYFGYDFVNKRGFIIDDHGHGTHVAGIIAALNPQAKILSLKVLNHKGRGNPLSTVEAIKYAISKKAKVINLSLGAIDALNTTKQIYEEVIFLARNAGVTVIAAAGNESNNNDQMAVYPSNTWQDNVLSVCANDEQKKLADFSNYGKWKVHLCAPGVEVVSLSNNFTENMWATKSGTSQAAPFVSAAASILYGLNSTLKPYQVRDILMNSSIKSPYLKNSSQTEGILNIEKAVKNLFTLENQ